MHLASLSVVERCPETRSPRLWTITPPPAGWPGWQVTAVRDRVLKGSVKSFADQHGEIRVFGLIVSVAVPVYRDQTVQFSSTTSPLGFMQKVRHLSLKVLSSLYEFGFIKNSWSGGPLPPRAVPPAPLYIHRVYHHVQPRRFASRLMPIRTFLRGPAQHAWRLLSFPSLVIMPRTLFSFTRTLFHLAGSPHLTPFDTRYSCILEDFLAASGAQDVPDPHRDQFYLGQHRPALNFLNFILVFQAEDLLRCANFNIIAVNIIYQGPVSPSIPDTARGAADFGGKGQLAVAEGPGAAPPADGEQGNS